MRFRLLVLFSFLTLCSGVLKAQDIYWVYFSDKQASDFNPRDYFDPAAIERRERMGLPLSMPSDMPVNPEYRQAVDAISAVRAESRWMNAVSVSPGDKLEQILALPIVAGAGKIGQGMKPAGVRHTEDIDFNSARQVKEQVASLGGDLFAGAGITGKGVRIAVFDGGFPGVDTLETFRHLREQKRIIATWDFVNNEEFVYDYNSHGTSVLGVIAGIYDSVAYGLGTGAEFLLARTEVATEVFSEEENWAMAVEWADKNGADIISSSLGYTYHRYFPKQMDGKSTFVTRMADMAASKGLLVINAAGNDGSEDWQVIGAPADADSILSVGGIDSRKGIHADFSSFGPTSDGRMKPNIVAFSDVITAGKKKEFKKAAGTSFATPMVSGFAACVMEMHPDWDNMKVLREIERSGHLYPYYDYAHGYGVPQASYFLGCREEITPAFSLSVDNGMLTIRIKPEVLQTLDDTIKCDIPATADPDAESLREQPSGNTGLHRYRLDDGYLYYHIASKETGKIRKYYVIRLLESDEYSIDLSGLREGEQLMIFHRGYSEIFELPLQEQKESGSIISKADNL